MPAPMNGNFRGDPIHTPDPYRSVITWHEVVIGRVDARSVDTVMSRPQDARTRCGTLPITGFEPINVKTVDDLDAYVEQCKRHYWGCAKDTQFLHWLIDKERLRCIGKK